MNDGILIIFCRVPEPGQVKTRIASKIGDEFTCGLYTHFIHDVMNMSGSVNADRAVYYTPVDVSEEKLKVFNGARTMTQRGSNLGERMFNALDGAFQGGYKKAVLIGSDVPDLSAPVIGEALGGLDHCDAVIGPAGDGGYYLIGFNSTALSMDFFSGIPWGSGTVCGQTLDLFRRHDLKVTILPQWNDIDTPEDLIDFYDRHRGNPRGLETVKFLAASEQLLRSF